MEKLKFSFLISWFCLVTQFLSSHAFSSDGYERGYPFKSHLEESNDYFRKIQPILDRRCVVCHSCFEAPCQLKLTSPQMLMRGASPHFAVGGLRASPRTDLMIGLDKQRAGGFFPITSQIPEEESILSLVLLEGNDKSQLPAEKYVVPEKRMCVSSPAKFKSLNAGDQKRLGMPYYMAALSDDEYKTLISWVEGGAKSPTQDELAVRLIPNNPMVIQHWEDFVNSPAWKARWTSRYLYEHLFTAHLYFEESPGEFYELVRSETQAPNDIKEIPTERPFEMPKQFVNTFYYRLRKLQATIVHKQHFVYQINKGTMAELQKLFWEPRWNSTPQDKPFSFKDRNPFIAFEHIPANARYRWMLKNARMLLDMDMRSDNCHGEDPSGPLHDSFLTLFVKPESDVAVRYPDYFKYTNSYLGMTNVSLSNVVLQATYKSNQVAYSKVKQHFQQQLLPNGFSFDDIWDGEKGTQMPLFTINRHEKTVSVHDGAWGPQQRVSLLFDYVSFERLYYNCVALATLFDKIIDKMGTVFYLRDVGREVEEQMLSFVPEEYRQIVRKEWIQGEGAKHRYDDSRFALGFNQSLKLFKDFEIDPKRPFTSMMDYLLLKSGRYTKQIVGNNHYPISQGSEEYHKLKQASLFMSQEQVIGQGHRAHHFPNISYLIVKGNSQVRYYTLIANRFYDYVNYIPYDPSPKDRLGRNADKDWMTVFSDIQANYPAKIYIVSENRLDFFIEKMQSVNNRAAYVNFDKTFGLQKMSPVFWKTIDALQTHFIQMDPIHNGLLDLGEYGVHDLSGSP